MRFSILLLGASLLLLSGCGGGGRSSSNEISNTPVTVTPSTVSLAPSADQQFTASIPRVLGAKLSWSIEEGAAGGTISQTGFYMAPPLAGTYHVIATANNPNSVAGTAIVTVHLTVAVSPSSPIITLGQTQQFNAAIVGSPNTAVTWRVEEGAAGGSISGGGLFSPVAPGTFHVIATSVADPTQHSTATVIVQAGSATGTIQ